MADITALILDDHDDMRRGFAALDDAAGADSVRSTWEPLAHLLEVHAAAEEAVFYPALLSHSDHGGDETEDAIRDHNDIRDAVMAARHADILTQQWWSAVRRARDANSDHMAEEEREALPDFRNHAPDALRLELGLQFDAYKRRNADRSTWQDKDPGDYIERRANSGRAQDQSKHPDR